MITNITKPTTSVENLTKVNIGEVLDTALLTWATETRTWNATVSIISNLARQSSSVTNVAKPA